MEGDSLPQRLAQANYIVDGAGVLDSRIGNGNAMIFIFPHFKL